MPRVAPGSAARRIAAFSRVASLLQNAKRTKAPALPLARCSCEKNGATGMARTPCSMASQRANAQSFVTGVIAELVSSRYLNVV